MLTLHEYTPSQNCWKVRVLLGLLGIPYRSQPVAIFSGESRTAEFLTLNPAGSTPALVLDDGRAIAESNAILCYLAEGTRFMPAANSPEGRFARAKVMQWLFFEQYYVEPVIGSLRFWTLTGRLESNAALVPGKRDAAMRALSALERTLGASLFLGGSDFTIADVANYAYAHLAADCGFPLAGFPSIARWADRLAGSSGPIIRSFLMDRRLAPLRMGARLLPQRSRDGGNRDLVLHRSSVARAALSSRRDRPWPSLNI